MIRRRSTSSALAGLLALGLLAASAPARADVTKDQCVDANGLAQPLRRHGRFAAAREQLRVCADPACPRIVREDCTRRLDELDAAQPTLVLDAKDRSGKDLVAVKVSVDGKPLASSLNGTALPVDPGEHTFTFEVAGQPVVTERYVLQESEKSRREVVVIGLEAPRPAASPPPAPISPTPPARSPSSSDSPWPAIGWVAGGIGVVGVGLGAVFGLLAISNNDSAECSGGNVCAKPTARYDAIHDANASTAAFVTGGVLLAAGIVIELVIPHGSAAASRQTGLVGPFLVQDGTGTVVGARF